MDSMILVKQQQQQQEQQLQANQTFSPSVEEQQQLLEGISFQIDNVTFSHHRASVNGIQMHYVIGGQGDPIVLLHGVVLCQLWLRTILLLHLICEISETLQNHQLVMMVKP
jgi:hypothetical protein